MFVIVNVLVLLAYLLSFLFGITTIFNAGSHTMNQLNTHIHVDMFVYVYHLYRFYIHVAQPSSFAKINSQQFKYIIDYFIALTGLLLS